jgi:hypothetical protein
VLERSVRSVQIGSSMPEGAEASLCTAVDRVVWWTWRRPLDVDPPPLAGDLEWVAQSVGRFSGTHCGPTAAVTLVDRLQDVVLWAEVTTISVMAAAGGFASHLHRVELSTDEGTGEFEEVVVAAFEDRALRRCWQLPVGLDADRLLRHLL